MAKKFREEDYFASTTMTFGEHLEELRKVLSRAVIALAIGFLVGLLISSYVVQFVQSPLELALEDFYIKRELKEMENRWGLELNDERRAELQKQLARRHMTPSYYYVEKAEVLRLADSLQEDGDPEPATRSNPAIQQASTRKQELDEVAKLSPLDPMAEMLLLRIWTPFRAKITTLNAQEAFMIWLKAAFLAGVVLASPYMFFQIWQFVAAGLYPHEQRYVYIYIPFSIALFLLGSSAAFFFVFKPVLSFLFDFNLSMNIDPDPRISEWIGFVLVLPLGFGIAFQLPLVMLFLNRLGIFTTKNYLDKWRIAVLVIFVVAMVLTPAEPVSMLMMAIPLCFLYFCGIVLCLWMPRIKNPLAEES